MRKKAPIFDKQVEDCVVQSILEGRHVALLLSDLSPEDFYDAANRSVFSMSKKLFSEGASDINAVLITAEANSADALDTIGGDNWRDRYRGLPQIINPDHYIKRLKRLRALRYIQARVGKLNDLALTTASDPQDICREMMSCASSAIDMLYSYGSISTVSEIVSNGIDPIVEKMSEAGVPSGYSDIDRIIRGFMPGEMVVIAGRPGMGKSSFLVSIFENLAVKKNNVGVVLFSLEMPKEMIIEKMIAGISRVPIHKIRHKHLMTDEQDRVSYACRVLSSFPMIIEDNPAVNLEQIAAALERAKRKIQVGLVAVDYLQLVMPSSPSKSYRKNRNEELDEISKGLKAIARANDVPMLLVSPLNRAPEARADKRPYLSDLRECGCLSPRSYLSVPSEAPHPIREIRFQFDVFSQSDGKVVTSVCSKTMYTGCKPMYRYYLDNGNFIECTRDHKIMTPSGWKEAGELRIGRKVVVARNVGCFPVKDRTLPMDTIERQGRLFGIGSGISSDAPLPWMIPYRIFSQDVDGVLCFLQSASRSQNNGNSLMIRITSEFEAQAAVHLLMMVGLNYKLFWRDKVLYIPDVTNVSRDPFCEIRISAIEHISMESCYDFSCPETENAIVNGVVTHNSLEYHADKVLFCMRPGVYKQERRDMDAKAEITIAKHRSGPCGTVEMVFNSQLSRFDSATSEE